MILCAALWLLSLRPSKEGFYGFDQFRYAHRGLHGKDIPENSLAAFSRAAKHGFGAELDVRLTKSGELIVFHDANLRRMTGFAGASEDLTAEQRKNLRLKSSQEHIPLLSEVLPIFEGRTPLILELKSSHGNHAELARRVCELLVGFPRLKFCIESFDPRVLRWLRKHRPDIVRGQLTYGSALNLSLNFWTKPHFVACKFEDRNSLVMRICRRLWGVREIFWTITTAADAKIAIESGANIIFEEELCTIN